MEEYLQQLQELVNKPDLTPLEVRDGMIATYVVISRLNQSQGNPDVGLKQAPAGLFGHIKGFMGAIFWERGFDFDNPTLDQLIETKIMTDGITQIYAMSEAFQIALNEVVAYLAGQAKGLPKSLSQEVQELLDLHPGQAAQTSSDPEPEAESQSDEDLAAALEPEPMPVPEPEPEPAFQPEPEPAADSALPEEIIPEPLPEEPEPQPVFAAESPAAPEDAIPEPTGDVLQWDTGLPPEVPSASPVPESEPEPESEQQAPDPMTEELETPQPDLAAAEEPAVQSETDAPGESPVFPDFGESAVPAEPQEGPHLPSDFPSDASLDALLEPAPAPAAPAPAAENVLAFETPLPVEKEPPPSSEVPFAQPEAEATEPTPKKRRGRKKKAVSAADAKPKEKKKRGRKPKVLAPGEEKPKRRKPRRKNLKIDLAAVQVPDDFMMDEEEALTGKTPEPPVGEESYPAAESFPAEEPQPEAVAEELPATPEITEPEETLESLETPDAVATPDIISDSELLSSMASDWKPEAIGDLPIANESEETESPSTSPEVEIWEPETPVESSGSTVDELIGGAEQPIEPADDLVEEDRLGFSSELGSEPGAEPGRDSESLAIAPEPEVESEPETQLEPEQEVTTASWSEGGSEMEPTEYTNATDAQPAEPDTGYGADVQEPQVTEPPKRKGGGLAAFFMLLLGLALGGGGSYYWFGIQEAQNAQGEIASLQQQLDEANENLAAVRTELAEAQDQMEQLTAEASQQQEAAMQPLAKPRFYKSGRTVVIWWLDKEVKRKYNFYRAKGSKAKLKKMNEKPMSSNVMILKKVSRGTWRYAVAGIDRDGEETELSETLKIRF